MVPATVLRAYRAWHQYQLGTNAAMPSRNSARRFITDYHKTRRVGSQIDMVDIESFTVFRWPPTRPIPKAISSKTSSPQFREALLLSVEDLQYDEIARVTGVAPGTVKSRLFRTRQVVQDALYDYAVEQGHIDLHEDADLGEAVPELVGAS